MFRKSEIVVLFAQNGNRLLGNKDSVLRIAKRNGSGNTVTIPANSVEKSQLKPK